MKRVLALALVGAVLPQAAAASDVFEKVGTYAAQFLKIGVSARATGMGSAFTAVADDASAAFWNPAGLVDVQGTVIALHHSEWPADINLDYANYTFAPAFVRGKVSLHARGLTMDPQVVRTVFRQDGTGEMFDSGDMSFGLSYARYFTDKFSAGVTVSWVHMGLADRSVNQVVGDFGLQYRIGIRGMKLGMMVQSIGSEVDFDNRPSKLPTVFKVGLSVDAYRAGPHAIIGVGEFSHPSDNQEHENFGIEYSYNKFLFLRSGYNVNFDAESFAAGAGIALQTSQSTSVDVDYSFVDMAALGSVHRVSLGFRY
ncbi:MAG TPA: PorV/PorQ family protein [Candidatus Krumholzibacteria bacterium]|nr:PorV/PorQ family protein [Candidatus Krumholzibacteria bacterium]